MLIAEMKTVKQGQIELIELKVFDDYTLIKKMMHTNKINAFCHLMNNHKEVNAIFINRTEE